MRKQRRGRATLDRERVKQRIRQLKTTQRALAETLDVRPRTIQHWLNGARSISIENLEWLAELLHIGSEEIVQVLPKSYERRALRPQRVIAQALALLRAWSVKSTDNSAVLLVRSMLASFQPYVRHVHLTRWPLHGFAWSLPRPRGRIHEYAELRLRPRRGRVDEVDEVNDVDEVDEVDEAEARFVFAGVAAVWNAARIDYGEVSLSRDGRARLTEYFTPRVAEVRVADDGWLRVWTWLSLEVDEWIVTSPSCDFEMEAVLTDEARLEFDSALNPHTLAFRPGPHHVALARAAGRTINSWR